MNIVFTKPVPIKMLSEKLGKSANCDFVEVIQIFSVKTEPFELKGKSLIFSSVNGVKSFFENGFKPCEDFLSPRFNKIYAIGKKTKAELRNQGFGTFKVTRNAAELSDFVAKNSANEKFLHFCGNLALDILDKKMPLQNICYQKIPVYRTVLLYPRLGKKYDAAAFFSPSGVRSFAKNNSLEGMHLFSIGQTTERELRAHTSQPIYTSRESNAEDLLNLIAATVLPKKAT